MVALAVPTPPPVQEVHINYEVYGGALEMMAARDIEVCMDGPAGTGKTVAALQKLHLTNWKYPGAWTFVTRKTNTNLTGSALATFRKYVIHPAERVKWFGGSREKPPGYMYPNGPDPSHPYEEGSFLAVFGMDKSEKVKSWEFDRGLFNEATEGTLDDIEFLRSRLRNGKTAYHQLLLDCNPSFPAHFLNQRMNEGRTRRILSRHQDNPRYFDRKTGEWTAEGKEYIEGILGGLTGVRRSRFLLGLWAIAEGAVYEDEWDEARNVIPRFEIPRDWPRYLVLDFGFNNPFVCQWWAMHDDELYCYREIYMSHRIVEDQVRDIKKAAGWKPDKRGSEMLTEHGDPLPRAVICDHDAEDRATFERHSGLYTIAATKSISDGIQAVKARLRAGANNKARMYFLENGLVELDPWLVKEKKPVCTTQEFESYIWDRRMGRAQGEEPVDADNHGMDCCRYMAAQFDLKPRSTITYGPQMF